MTRASAGTGGPRITHVVRQFWPQQGGLEESVRQLCVALRRDFGANVDVVTLDRTFSDGAVHPEHDMVEGIPVRRIGYHGSQRYPVAPAFLAATAGADLLHVHAIDFFFDSLALARTFRDVPMVASTHGGFFHTAFASRLKSAYFATVTRASCRAYDVIGASSIADAERFAPIAADRLEVIENGVDIAKWSGAGSETFAPVMIAIGRWSSNKNMAALFPLLAALRSDGTPWQLIIAGNPHDVSRADLDRWATAARVSDAVEIHTGPSTQALTALIGRASFFVSLSDYEGFGIAAVEGLSAGLVPILSDIANYRVFIERAGVGTIVPRDAETAAALIRIVAKQAAANPGEYRHRAMAAATQYEWRAVAARWQAIYTRLLDRQSRKDFRVAA